MALFDIVVKWTSFAAMEHARVTPLKQIRNIIRINLHIDNNNNNNHNDDGIYGDDHDDHNDGNDGILGKRRQKIID